MRRNYLRVLFFHVFLSNFFFASCQNSNFVADFTVGETVYNKKDTTINKIIGVLERYQKIRKLNPRYKGDFWSNRCSDYSIPDYFLKSELLQYSKYDIKENLIYIHKQDSSWIAQIGYHLYENNKFKGTACVYNYGVIYEQDNLKLIPYIELLNLTKFTTQNITFYYTNKNMVNALLNDSLNKYNNHLSKIFNTKPKIFRSYVFNSFSELNSSIGLDVHIAPNITKNNAYTDFYNNSIYATSFQSFFHELTHLYTNTEFYGCHTWFDEGLALLLGGSVDKDFNYHIKSLRDYLVAHKDVDLNNALDYSYIYINQNTSFMMDVGGLLCSVAYKKNGYDGIKKLLSAGNTEKEFYEAIEKYLGVKRENLNTFIRNELEKY